MTVRNQHKTVYTAIAALIFLVALNQAAAQNRPYNEEITVIAAFDPIIPDAFKINSNPSLTDTLISKPVISFNIPSRPLSLRPELETIPAVKLVADPLTKLYRNYIKLGAGNYSTLYGELFASSLRSKKHLISFHAGQYASLGKIKDYGYPGNSHSQADLFAQKYFSNHTLSGKLYVDRRGLHYYGFNPLDTKPDKDSYRQRFFTAGAQTAYSSTYSGNQKLNHSFGLSYNFVNDLFKTSENNIRFNTSLNKHFDFIRKTGGPDLGLDFDVNHLNQKDSVGKAHSTLIMLSPYGRVKFDEYSLKAGLNFYVAADTVTKPYLFPFVEGRIDLIKGALQVFAGLDGSMEQVSFKELAMQNEFIQSARMLDYTKNKFRAYGGFRSNISKTFNINASIASTTFEDMHFFRGIYIKDQGCIFEPVYDDGSLLNIMAELEYVKAEKLSLSATGNFYSYNLEELAYAFYKPDYTIAFNGKYNFQNKITIKTALTYNGPVWEQVPHNPEMEIPDPQYQQIKGWLDADLGADYHFNKALTFWLTLNDLGNSRYFLWHNYPSYRFNALAGVSYSF